jgi:hypothetical protein
MKSLRLILVLALTAGAAGAAEPVPLTRVHAHNDYEHTRPLFDALDHGFTSVEADIYLVDGKLLVAHDLKNVKPERTLEALYLDPLRERVKQNGGRVYRGGPTITLLIDVKSEAASTYAALHAALEKYADLLTTFRGNTTKSGAITVIVSGNRAPAAMLAQPFRYAAMDGRVGDLDGTSTSAFIPWISDNWQKVFTWRWTGPMPDADREKLRALVAQTHAQGRQLRLWNTPDRPDAWKLLYDAGVDIINTDDLAGLQAFMLAQRAAPTH